MENSSPIHKVHGHRGPDINHDARLFELVKRTDRAQQAILSNSHLTRFCQGVLDRDLKVSPKPVNILPHRFPSRPLDFIGKLRMDRGQHNRDFLVAVSVRVKDLLDPLSDLFRLR